MKLSTAVDQFIADMKAEGRLNSPHSIKSYETKLWVLVDECGNRDPSKVGKDDVKRTLEHWTGNSRRQAHSIIRSFFRWTLEEGLRRETNPADLVRRTKAKRPNVYFMSRDEAVAFIEAANDNRRDRWVAALGLGAGLRASEITRLRGKDLVRPGWIQVFGKGQKVRWVPVLREVEPIIAEILTLVGPDDFVLPGQRIIDPPHNTKRVEDPQKELSRSALYWQVRRIAERAGIQGRVTPHVLRRGFATYVGKHSGALVARELLGHERLETTAGYIDRPSLDELQASVRAFRYTPGDPLADPSNVMAHKESADPA